VQLRKELKTFDRIFYCTCGASVLFTKSVNLILYHLRLKYMGELGFHFEVYRNDELTVDELKR